MATSKRHTILLVDAEASVRSALRGGLRSHRFDILEAASGPAALDLMREQRVDVIIADPALPGMTGVDLLQQARAVQGDCVRILLTGQADLEAAVMAINQGAVDRFLFKPWDYVDLNAVVRLAVCRLEDERRGARAIAERRTRRSAAATAGAREEPDAGRGGDDDELAAIGWLEGVES